MILRVSASRKRWAIHSEQSPQWTWKRFNDECGVLLRKYFQNNRKIYHSGRKKARIDSTIFIAQDRTRFNRTRFNFQQRQIAGKRTICRRPCKNNRREIRRMIRTWWTAPNEEEVQWAVLQLHTYKAAEGLGIQAELYRVCVKHGQPGETCEFMRILTETIQSLWRGDSIKEKTPSWLESILIPIYKRNGKRTDWNDR